MAANMASAWGAQAKESSRDATRVDADGTVVKMGVEPSSVAFFGADELRSGVSTARFKVVKSDGGTGGNMNIGVVDASVPAQYASLDRDVAWALIVIFGKLRKFRNPVSSGGTQGKVLGKAGNTGPSVNGLIVELTIDMDRRKLLVSVAGAPAVDTDVALPEAVRLWCSLYNKGDAVQLVSFSKGGGAQAVPAAAAPTLPPPPPPTPSPAAKKAAAEAKLQQALVSLDTLHSWRRRCWRQLTLASRPTF